MFRLKKAIQESKNLGYNICNMSSMRIGRKQDILVPPCSRTRTGPANYRIKYM